MNRGTGKDNGTKEQRDPTSPCHLRPAARLLPLFLLASLALPPLTGCTSAPVSVDKSLMAEGGATARNEGVAEHYRIGCPDVLEVTVVGRPELSDRCKVRPDGRVDLGELGKLRVEGQTVTEVTRAVAGTLALPEDYVDVRVAEFHSQCLYLFGEVNGLQRSVPYRGRETVLDLLQRVGGLTQGAAPEEVYVVRSRVLEGQRPEVFHVDLRAIVVDHDAKSNVRLEPFDQVHVGATRRARLEKCLPPWLRPLFHALCGQFPTPHAEDPARSPSSAAEKKIS